MKRRATSRDRGRDATGIRQLLVAGACLLLSAAPSPAEAGSFSRAARWQVWLDTGSSIRVASVVPDDAADLTAAFTRLVLPSGGSIRVPSSRVRRLEEVAPESALLSAAHLPEAVTRWDSLVERVARRHALDPELVRAVIHQESLGDPEAVSPKGAVGLMQLLPSTAADYGVTRLTDPERNLEAGCRHLARLSDKMSGDLRLTLAAYNAGEGAVARFGGVPAYTETRDYVRRILASLGRRAG